MDEARIQQALQSIAANVRALRDERGLTQEQLAELAGIHLTYLQSIERGKRNLSVGVLLALAESLRVTPAALLDPRKLKGPVRGRPRKRRDS